MAEELGLGINKTEFEEAQASSKEASRGPGKKGITEVIKLDVHDIASLESNSDIPKTDDNAKFSLYLSCQQFASH